MIKQTCWNRLRNLSVHGATGESFHERKPQDGWEWGRSHPFLQSAPDWACWHIQTEKSSHCGKSTSYKDENVHHEKRKGTARYKLLHQWPLSPEILRRRRLLTKRPVLSLTNFTSTGSSTVTPKLLTYCKHEPVKFQLGAVCSCKQSHTSNVIRATGYHGYLSTNPGYAVIRNCRFVTVM